MPTLHPLHLWTSPGLTWSRMSPMVASLLWLPDGYRPGASGPAVVLVHDWMGYPYDDPLPAVGEALAAEGIPALAVTLRRRGLEGQCRAMPEDDLADLKQAIDYLHQNGATHVGLAGWGVGSLSVARYLAQVPDARVAGGWAIDPAPDLPEWLAEAAGHEAYEAMARAAAVATRQGQGLEYRVDPGMVEGRFVSQYAASFLAWFGPAADTRFSRLEARAGGRLHRLETGGPAETAAAIAGRLVAAGGPVQAPVEVSLASVTVPDGTVLRGLVYRQGERRDLVQVLVHGLTSTPLTLLYRQQAPLLAQTHDCLVVETRRSGLAGHEASVADNDMEDLDAWMEWLLAQGYQRVVLSGASMGSITVGRFHSLRQHPAVAGVIHYMPTADCSWWMEASAGPGAYRDAAEAAQEARLAGEGTRHLVDLTIHQAPPDRYGSRGRWQQRGDAWLSWWGPGADTTLSQHIGRCTVPILLVTGSEDSYNDWDRLDALEAAAVQAPRVDRLWLEDVDHGLGGVELEVARGTVGWLRDTGLLGGQS